MRKPKWFLYYNKTYEFHLLPEFKYFPLRWKDKFGDPRCEQSPYFYIRWLWFDISGSKESDQYWEQWLWIHKYNGGDEKQAKERWGWINMDTHESSWKEFT